MAVDYVKKDTKKKDQAMLMNRVIQCDMIYDVINQNNDEANLQIAKRPFWTFISTFYGITRTRKKWWRLNVTGGKFT